REAVEGQHFGEQRQSARVGRAARLDEGTLTPEILEQPLDRLHHGLPSCPSPRGTDRDHEGGALTILEPLAAGWRGLLEVFREFAHDDCVPLAGSIAFFTLFSFPPILGMVVELAGLVVAPEVARAEILESVELFAGANAAEQTGA